MRNIPDSHFALSVLISLGQSSGSGFLFRTELYMYVVTAKHVIFDEQGKLRTDEIEVTCQTNNIKDESVRRLRIDLKKTIPIIDKKTDVTVIKYGKTEEIKKDNSVLVVYLNGVEELEKGNYNPVSATKEDIKILEEIMISNDVYVFGYPTSIGLETSIQFEYSKPLLRKGIIANVYKKAQTIILDCPVYG